MKITRFDQNNVRQVREALAKAVKTVEDEYGIKVDFAKSVRYSSDEFKYSMTVKAIPTNLNGLNEADKNKELAKANWVKHCWRFGLKKESFGGRFNYQGRIFEIVGIAEKSKKYPILAKQIADGKTYKFYTSAIDESKLKFSVEDKPRLTI